MLVLPHHFQAADAQLREFASTTADWLSPDGFGLYDIEINETALSSNELRIPKLKARLKDGTLISIPGNARLPSLDLKPVFEQDRTVYLHLVLPELVPGQPNSSRSNGEDRTRYSLETQSWDEIHGGQNSRPIDLLTYNCEIASTATPAAPKNCQSIPIAKLSRGVESNSPPEIDPDYIPPLLECRCWPQLSEDILATVQSQLGGYIASQADYLNTRGGWMEANQPQIRRAIVKLVAVTSSFPVFTQLISIRGTHPRTAYFAMCRMIGELSALRDDWTPPKLPLYDHENLGPLFRHVKAEIEASLTGEVGAKVERHPFNNVGEWMEVAVDPKWLQAKYEIYVGVHCAELSPERLERMFSDKYLDWKLGSSRMVNQIFRGGEQGLQIKRFIGVHPQLPVLNNLTYFSVRKRGNYWEQVAESRTIALKVNEQYVRNQELGQNVLTIVDPRKQRRDLTLELFVLEK
jgi:type VI secretion system protein ImpJ